VSITNIQFAILGNTAFVLAGLLTWPIRALAIKLSVMDMPNMERKTQKEPVPYLGGVAIALSITIVTYGAIYFSDYTKTTFPLVTYALLPAAILGLMGLIDDIQGLPALPRLIAQTIVAIFVTRLTFLTT
jgi:UDP-GlcNAc:undecaprenyl-phosphate GlcNAc-1-phosphate transferase